MTKVSETIPMEKASWNSNPSGYVRHQAKLREFAECLERHNVTIELPVDGPGHDFGVDLIVGRNKAVFDLKTFGLRRGPNSYTWDSTYYAGKPKPVYDGWKTEFYIHPTDGPVEEWLVCEASGLHTSKFADQPPYYYPNNVQTLDSFLNQCAF